MKETNALIFDLDGTLWNTCEVCARAWNKVVDHHDYGIPKLVAKDIETYMGMTIPEIEARFFSGHDGSTRKRFFHQYMEQEVVELKETPGKIYQGVTEGLDTLGKHFPLYLVSNCQQDYLDEFLNKSGLGHLFKDSLCFGATGKPKGHNLKLLIKKNKLSKPAYIGDTRGDEVASIEAGIPFVFAEYGFGQSDDHAFSIRSFNELVKKMIPYTDPV